MRYAQMVMRHFSLKLAALIIVAICVGGHISELFDRWENAVLSGGDIDYTCVVVAATFGAIIVISGILRKLLLILSKPGPRSLPRYDHVVLSILELVTSTHSPPLVLRI